VFVFVAADLRSTTAELIRAKRPKAFTPTSRATAAVVLDASRYPADTDVPK
jgi:hypothetical protein